MLRRRIILPPARISLRVGGILMRYGKLAAGAALAALLLLEPGAAALGALNAMLCWARTVAPALFPFMALLPLLTGEDAARAWERLLGRPMRRLFRLPGAAAGALAAGLLGGSPAGALAARRAPGLRRDQRRRLAAATAGLSPSFLVGGVGAGMLGSAALGHVLLRAQLASQLILLCLLRAAPEAEEPPSPPAEPPAAAPPLRDAVLAVLTVGGWMALFGALGQSARRLLGDGAEALICLADVVTGAQRIARLGGDVFPRMLLIAALCGFGGGCVGLQNLAVLRDTGLRAGRYFAARLLAAGLCALLTAAQLQLRGARFPATDLPALPASALAAALLALPALWTLKKTAN